MGKNNARWKYVHALRWLLAVTDNTRPLPYPPPSAQTLNKAAANYHASKPRKGSRGNGQRTWLLTLLGRAWLEGWDAHIDYGSGSD